MTHPRFVQILSHDGTLFALSESGQVWGWVCRKNEVGELIDLRWLKIEDMEIK